MAERRDLSTLASIETEEIVAQKRDSDSERKATTTTSVPVDTMDDTQTTGGYKIVVDTVDSNDQMNKKTLLEIHQNQLKNNQKNDQNTKQIAAALGGIDAILTHYLQHPDIILEEQDIIQIHTLITTQNASQNTASSMHRTHTRIQKETADIGDIRNVSLIVDLEDDNSYLHSFVSEERYYKLLHIMHHWVTHMVMWLSCLVWFGLVSAFYDIALLWSIYIIIVAIFVWIPYCTIWLLSVNKTAFRYIIRSFDFWIKAVYLSVWGVFELSHRFLLQKGVFEKPLLAFFAYLLFDIFLVLYVIVISAFDGYATKKLWTVMSPGMVAVVCLMYSGYYQVQSVSSDDSIVHIRDGVEFSLRGVMVNAQRIIGIFFAKQAYAAFRYRNKATTISIKPTLNWIRVDKTKQNS